MSLAFAAIVVGLVFIDNATHLKVGDIVEVEFEDADDHDMWAHLV